VLARCAPTGLELVETSVAVDVFEVYSREPKLRVAVDGQVFVLPHAPLLPGGSPELRLEIHRRPHHPPEQGRMAAALSTLRADPARFDGTLVSLRSLSRRGSGWHGRLRPVSYFDARAAESLLDSDGLRSQECQDGSLPPVGKGALAGDMGVVVLLQTNDEHYVLQRRGPDLDWRAGLLSVTASGSLEPGPDLVGAELGLSDLLRGAARELEEEVGVGGDQGVELVSLGIWRELARGGKPELYAAARVSLDAAAVADHQARARDAHEAAELRAVPLPQSGGELCALVKGLLAEADPALLAALLLDGARRGLGVVLP
jgi:hypothetical protein